MGCLNSKEARREAGGVKIDITMMTVDSSRSAVVSAPMTTTTTSHPTSQIPRPIRGSIGARSRTQKAANANANRDNVGNSSSMSPKASGATQPAAIRSRSNSVAHSVRSESTSISGRSATKTDRNVLAQRNSIRMVKSDSNPDISKEEQRKAAPQHKRTKSNVSTGPKTTRMKAFPEETTGERMNRAKAPPPEVSKIPIRKGTFPTASLNGRKTLFPEVNLRGSIPTPFPQNSENHRISRSYTTGDFEALNRKIAAAKPDDFPETRRPVTPGRLGGATSFIPVRAPSSPEVPRLRGGSMARQETESDVGQKQYTATPTVSPPSSMRSRIPVATRSISGVVNA